MKNRNTVITTALLALGFLAMLPAPKAFGVVPPPDGGYPGGNTAEGQAALLSLTTGGFNTAVGFFSLRSDSSGGFNTGIGAGALLATTGDQNTATGAGALLSNSTGNGSTASGAFALFNNTTGGANTANGSKALLSNTTGNVNTATGVNALSENTTGAANTADGSSALAFNTTGDNNIALGINAGLNLTTGDNNIDIGNIGVSDESGTIRIGGGLQNRAFIGGIRGVTTGVADAIPVLIDSVGQLGTVSSSRRFKSEVKPMNKASEAILALKPVTFHYKTDKTDTPQFGLIAEEVAEVNRDLVIYDADRKPYTVRYDAVNAMLLNEFLKEHEKVHEQQVTIAELKVTVGQQKQSFQSRLAKQEKQIQALASGLQKVSAQIEMNRATPRVVSSGD